MIKLYKMIMQQFFSFLCFCFGGDLTITRYYFSFCDVITIINYSYFRKLL